MANLLDAIRGNTTSVADQQQGMGDDTNKLQTLLRAKSGKDVGGGATSSSNLGEQSAVSQTNQTLKNQLQPAAQVQNTAQATTQAGQEQANQQTLSGIAQGRNINNQQTQLQINNTLSQLQRDKGKVDEQQYAAGLDQVAQNLRLQTKEYTDNLAREGTTNRLQNADSFKEELAKAQFGDATDLLQQKLGDASIIDANQRDFNKAMGSMDTNQAYDVFKAEAKAAKNKSLFEGIAKMGQGAIGSMGSGSGDTGAASSSGSSSAGSSSAGDASYQGLE